MTEKITPFPLRAPVVTEFALELKALVSKYVGRLSVAETVGTLEVVKLEVFAEQQSDEDDLADQISGRMSELLTQTANALKGEPKPLHRHDWADLPKVAAEIKERTKWYEELRQATDGPSESMTHEDAVKEVNWLRAELARLKAQEPVAWLISSKDWWPESVAVTQKPTGLLGNETLQPLFLASGAAPQENT